MIAAPRGVEGASPVSMVPLVRPTGPPLASLPTPRGLRRLFAWHVALLGLGLALALAAVFLAGWQEDQGLEPAVWLAWSAGLALSLATLGGLRLIYWFWRIIQDHEARTRPGRAAALLLIPVFNLYWVFPAIGGLIQDMNSYCRRAGWPMPPLASGPASAFCLTFVLCFVPLLNCLALAPNLVLWFWVAGQCTHRSLAMVEQRWREAGQPASRPWEEGASPL